MSRKNEIIDWLKNSKDDCYCDRCLTKLLNIDTMQYTNIICNELMHRNQLVRKHGVCSKCGENNIVNSIR